jgi:hypothetical protein
VSAALTKATVATIAAILLGVWSAFRLRRSLGGVLQFIGALGCLIVAGAHICEALQVLPSMGWGHPNTVGHYLDLSGAVLAIMLFPLGVILQWRRSR